jgi:hypothetical protein
VNPFNIFFEKYDIHVMLYFLDHPKYESIEAMIHESEYTQIRLILTMHDQSQIDYLNNQDAVNKILSDGIRRETHFADIEYIRGIIGRKPEVSIGFMTIDEEKFEFYVSCASPPSKSHAGLTNPEGHSADTTFPIMYREMSSLASEKSSVIIDGKSYEIPILVNIPLFFKGLKGYYSEKFKLAVIRTGEQTIEIIQSPSAIEPGEKWVYKNGNDLTEYVIGSIDDTTFTITSGPTVIHCIAISNQIGILSITTFPSNCDDGTMVIQFESPVFSSPSIQGETAFRINTDNHEDLVTGKFIYGNTQQTQVFVLIPDNPKWARKRNLQTTIEYETAGAKWKSIIQ